MKSSERIKGAGLSLRYPAAWRVYVQPPPLKGVPKDDPWTYLFSASHGDESVSVRKLHVVRAFPRSIRDSEANWVRSTNDTHDANGYKYTVLRASSPYKIGAALAFRGDLRLTVESKSRTGAPVRVAEVTTFPSRHDVVVVTVRSPDVPGTDELLDSILGSLRAA